MTHQRAKKVIYSKEMAGIPNFLRLFASKVIKSHVKLHVKPDATARDVHTTRSSRELSNPSAQTHSKTVGIFARKKKLFSWGAGRFLLKLQNEIFEEKTWRLATRWSNIFQEKVSLFQFSRVLFLIYRWWSSPTANKTSMYIVLVA